MQNLRPDELIQNLKPDELMQNWTLDQLMQIAKMRRIKNYKNMPTRAKTVITLKKSERTPAEHYKNDSNDARIKKIRKEFTKLRDRFLKPKEK